jgi:hypothetical protein
MTHPAGRTVKARFTATLFLRTAAVLTVLYALGHTSGYPWKPPPGAREDALVHTMQSLRFEELGEVRTLWDYYIGFGFVITGYMLTIGVVLFQLGALARVAPRSVRPMTAAIALCFVVNAALTHIFFFTPPLVFAIGVVLFTAAGFVLAGRAAAPPREIPATDAARA